VGDVHPIKANDWSTETSDYSRDTFYTGSTDGNGGSVSMTISVPPAMVSQLAALVQSGRFPSLRTKEAAIRDALHHRLHDYGEMLDDPEFERRTALWRRIDEAGRRKSELDAIEAHVGDVRELLERARGKGDRVMEAEIVQDAEAAAADLHEPWRGLLLDVVRDAGVGDEGL
jgi:Arc/MetJ-type ribon-helix-helix transcriptional regulator